MDQRAARLRIDSRGSVPAVAIALLLVGTLVLAGTLGASAMEVLEERTQPAPRVVLSSSVDSESDAVHLTHRGGETLDVRVLRVRIFVDDVPLRFQPSVPFFAARGYRGGPAGPFNSASDPRWTAGETATLHLAGTNAPYIERDSRVRIKIYANGTLVAVVETTAG